MTKNAMSEQTSKDDVGELDQFASPACSMHEVDPVYMGLAPALFVERATHCGVDAAQQDEFPIGGTAPPNKEPCIENGANP